MAPYHYTAFGLTVASELHCPELPAIPPVDAADVTIRLGEVIDRIEVDRAPDPEGTFRFHVAGIGSYRAVAGREIVVEPLAGAVAGDVRLFLLGSVFGALLHQRGRMPLHACAACVDGWAVAFCGDSGAGKSTLAAALHGRGFPLLSDDAGVIVPDGEGHPMYHPGVPRIRLWRDALDHFGIATDGLVRDSSRADKFHLAHSALRRSAALPLLCLYVLDRGDPDAPVALEPLPLAEKIPRLMDCTYRPDLARALAGGVNHFRQCAWIAQNVPVRRFRRPWSLARLDEALDALVADIRGMAASAAPRPPQAGPAEARSAGGTR